MIKKWKAFEKSNTNRMVIKKKLNINNIKRNSAKNLKIFYKYKTLLAQSLTRTNYLKLYHDWQNTQTIKHLFRDLEREKGFESRLQIHGACVIHKGSIKSSANGSKCEWNYLPITHLL